ncbi:WD40-repeat-containing domain protein [Rhizoctonia solani]|nr:WD40-repeat-containing domain protein [Rhizoctonia solani]
MVKRARIAPGPKPMPPQSPEHTEPAKSPYSVSEPAITAPPSAFKIIVGTYEKLLYGLEGHVVDDPGSEHKFSITLTPIFIFPAHVACVRAVAASPQGGKWLATGSTDEIVKVWDLRRRKEVGGLVQHQGSITHLSFPSRSHLLSASEDGTLALFSTRDWALLRTLKGHKGRVNDVSMHPSGKVALSVGKDRTLRMWDMMRGKGSASTKLGKEGELVRWSVSGKIFVVQAGSTLEIFQTDMTLLDTITHASRVHDVKFWASGDKLTHELLLVAAEDKLVTVYQIDSEERTSRIIARFEGHTNRVKALDILPVSSPGSKNQKTTLMSTASSDGIIFIYDLSQIPSNLDATDTVLQLKPVASYDTKGSRLVCLIMADGDPAKDPGTSLGKRTLE